ncbi:uncharacterized protein N0V96_004690 [Colletotrichum fioriniae]|uniref:uncharacterized protein n=1 Tax=Colletotrichum fioriniae TaxID=710243 RepID=UPI0032DBE642|nr:hypothetical protein N0V96_004690 [Colletotrichum fioriniae]
MSPKILQVGVIGGGDVAQIVHLPTFMLLSSLFKVVSICDVSRKTADHCRAKFSIPHATTNPDDIFNDPAIDVVVILTSDEYHAPYTIAALKAGKNVLLEKPMTLSLQAADEIIDAETKAPNNARVFVGYMRRYAPSLQAFKREIASIDKIKYARVRDIIGPNAYFIGQSGAHPQKYHDDIPIEASEDRKARLAVLLGQAWGQEPESLTAAQMDYCCLLGSLGSHGLSLMRNVLGVPKRHCPDDRFTCVYEMGIDSVLRFDSHVAVYGENKSVTICYDTPFVKGLGITVEIDELNEHGEKSHRSLQTSYEDAYTAELKEWYETVVHGKEVKTSAKDARDDLRLFKMMMDKFPEHKKIKDASDSTPFVPSGP